MLQRAITKCMDLATETFTLKGKHNNLCCIVIPLHAIAVLKENSVNSFGEICSMGIYYAGD